MNYTLTRYRCIISEILRLTGYMLLGCIFISAVLTGVVLLFVRHDRL